MRSDRRAVELSVYPLTRLLRKENLGDPHPIIAGGNTYVSPRFENEVERALRDALNAAGLGDRDEMDTFRGRLALVHRAQTEFYGWVSTKEGSYAVLVAASGRQAVVLTRVGEQVQIAKADPNLLVETLIRELPDVPAGRGDSISVREADNESASSRPAGGSVMRRAGGPRRPEQARQLDELLNAPRIGLAKLYAARRDQYGDRVRSRDWITVIDLPTHGRWLVYPTLGRGERAINAIPGTPQLLATKLTELAATAR